MCLLSPTKRVQHDLYSHVAAECPGEAPLFLLVSRLAFIPYSYHSQDMTFARL